MLFLGYAPHPCMLKSQFSGKEILLFPVLKGEFNHHRHRHRHPQELQVNNIENSFHHIYERNLIYFTRPSRMKLTQNNGLGEELRKTKRVPWF